MIKELSFVAYYVRDVPRARQFFGEVLGLPPGQWFNDNWIEFDLGNTTFALDGTGEELCITPGTSPGAAFEVDDIDAMPQAWLTQERALPMCTTSRRAGSASRKIAKATALRSINSAKRITTWTHACRKIWSQTHFVE